MPFKNYALTKGGQLTIGQILSPNFVHGVSGWSINKDGSAEFHDIIIPAGSGGTVVTFAASAPASPNVGDVWYDTAAGLAASVWSGSAWTAYSIGTGAIASGAITTSLIAANAVTAAQIANATITGTQLASSVTARSLGGITTTIAGTAPGSPNTGDLWIDSASGYQLNQWNGSAWTAVSWNAADVISAATITGSLIAASTITGGKIAAGTITASNIAANTITASQLAAGIVYAGIVDSTTITGATIIADGSSGQILVYSGTPAAGNLLASVSGASGTDSHGNAYQAGVYVYGPSSSFAGLLDNGIYAELQLFPPGATVLTDHPAVFSNCLNAGGALERMYTVLTSGKSSANDDAALQVFSQSSDGTLPAVAILEFGGTTSVQVDKTRVILAGQSVTPSSSSGNAVLYGTGSGGLSVVDGLDGEAYATQRRTLIVSSDTPVAASPGTTVFSTAVGVRSYLVKGQVIVSISGTAQQLSINIAPPAGTGHAGSFLARAGTLVAATDFNLNSLTGLGASGSLSVGNKYICRFETIINVTGAGTLDIIFAGTNASDVTVLANSYCSVEVV